MLSLTSVSASEVVIGDVADIVKPPCQRVHAATVTVCRRPDSKQRWLTPVSHRLKKHVGIKYMQRTKFLIFNAKFIVRHSSAPESECRALYEVRGEQLIISCDDRIYRLVHEKVNECDISVTV